MLLTALKSRYDYRPHIFYLILQRNKRKPYHSVNFIIAHDGLTLYDLVSYNFKVCSNFKSISLFSIESYSMGYFS